MASVFLLEKGVCLTPRCPCEMCSCGKTRPGRAHVQKHTAGVGHVHTSQGQRDVQNKQCPSKSSRNLGMYCILIPNTQRPYSGNHCRSECTCFKTSHQLIVQTTTVCFELQGAAHQTAEAGPRSESNFGAWSRNRAETDRIPRRPHPHNYRSVFNNRPMPGLAGCCL